MYYLDPVLVCFVSKYLSRDPFRQHFMDSSRHSEYLCSINCRAYFIFILLPLLNVKINLAKDGINNRS